MPIGTAERLMPTLRRVVLGRQSAARSDGELLGAFVATNDADSFAELVRRHGPMVLGVCRRVTGDRGTADDAFQATFLVLARRAAAVRPREQVGNFLYGVAYRTALKARTVLARRRARERQVDVMPEPTAPPVAPWDDVKDVIDEELDRLPDKLRLPVVLCDLEGRPQREVAKRLNVPPATLATRLASARRTLAQRLTRRGVTLSGGALAGLLGTHASAFAVPPGLADGVVRAVEVGAPVGSLVSANALHLSEGVLRMMMLAKLKAVAVLAVTALALTTGLGVGLVPAAADEPTPKTATVDKVVPKAVPAAGAAARTDAPAPTDDLTFLRRLTMDVRGTPPTDVEVWFFVADADGEKRAKVVNWVTDDDAARLAIAKKLGVAADRLKLVRGKLSADGQFVEVTLDKAGEKVIRATTVVDPVAVAFSPDGGTLAIQPNKANVNTTETVWVRDYNAAVANRVRLWDAAAADADTALRVWQKAVAADDKSAQANDYRAVQGKWIAKADADKAATVLDEVFVYVNVSDSDAEFLKRVLADVRGSGPTALETKYFTEDKDPKKREKLLDTLLKDPVVQKKLGEAWKAKMLAPQTAAKPVPNTTVVQDRFIYRLPDGTVKEELRPRTINTMPPAPMVVKPFAPAAPVPPTPPAPPMVVKPLPPQPGVKVIEPPVVTRPLTPVKVVEGTADVLIARQPDKFDKLVDSLIAAKKDDAAILEAVTLAALSRLPTDVEKKLAAGVGKAADRKAAWVGVARALAGDDAQPTPIRVKMVEAPVKPPAPPVPPAKP